MDFGDVVRRRRMVRTYDPDRPVDRAQIDRLLDSAVRAPSAGFSQGWHFLVLDDADTRGRFWAATGDEQRTPDAWLRGMKTAPVLILVFSERAAYERRYAQADKSAGHAPVNLDLRWTVPYWHLDAAMAALLVLLTAVDEHLGAAWFGLPPAAVPVVRTDFGLPPTLEPVGVIAVGHPAPDRPRQRPAVIRRPRSEVVSYGRYGESARPDRL